MTSQEQPPNQNLEKSKFGGGHDDLNNLSSYQALLRFRKETVFLSSSSQRKRPSHQNKSLNFGKQE
jgi:hypothetical protein